MNNLDLQTFLVAVQRILKPYRGDEFYRRTSEDRYKAFLCLYNESKDWLKDSYYGIYRMIEDTLDKIQDAYCCDTLLDMLVIDIYQKVIYYLMEEY